MHQSVIRIGPAPLQAQQTSVIYKVATQSIPQDYPPPAPPMKSSPVVTTTVNTYPVMDATVASSVKGEPELNIGNIYLFALRTMTKKGTKPKQQIESKQQNSILFIRANSKHIFERKKNTSKNSVYNLTSSIQLKISGTMDKFRLFEKVLS